MTTIKQGWLTSAQRIPSPNYDARPDPTDISLIVLHCISLPPEQFGGPYIQQFFCNQLAIAEHDYFATIANLKVSAHLVIQRNGTILQFVPLTHRAWHAGVSTFQGRERCNDFSIGIELEGADHIAYEQRQYHTLLPLLQTLQQHYPNTKQNPVVGHCHIAPDRKTDPGPAFEWQQLTNAGILTIENN